MNITINNLRKKLKDQKVEKSNESQDEIEVMCDTYMELSEMSEPQQLPNIVAFIENTKGKHYSSDLRKVHYDFRSFQRIMLFIQLD